MDHRFFIFVFTALEIMSIISYGLQRAGTAATSTGRPVRAPCIQVHAQDPPRRKKKYTNVMGHTKRSGSESESLEDAGAPGNAFQVAAEMLGWEVQGVDRADEGRAGTGGQQQPASVIIFEEQSDVMEDVFELEEESDSEFEDGMGDLALEDMDGEDGLVWTIDGEIPFEDGDYPTTEAFLESLPRHMKRRLSEEQQEVNTEEERLEANSQRKVAARRKTHRKLRIISGTAASVRLFSPQGDQTRPMMEKVRGAVFSMIGSMYGSMSGLPSQTRWLDLFAGTGAVGLEGMSRGVGEGHFVELSDWVVSNCLAKNIENCGVSDRAVIHTMKAEEYLRRNAGRAGTFDFISVCPPYELVSYEELYELLEASGMIGEGTVVLVEYPERVKSAIVDELAGLTKVRDRKYGRTWLALYT